jgi:formylmethanofuran--tetrahydromethanopterin N-formyltransferase
MKIKDVQIQDTYAEAWELQVVRLVLTALTEEIALGGAHQFVGAAGSSELGSRINAGIERMANTEETPDGRPGVYIQLTQIPKEIELMKSELELRVALATLIPSIAIFDAAVVETSEKINIAALTHERWKGYDSEREVGGRSVVVVPTMPGEFIFEKEFNLSTTGTDGHLVCYAESLTASIAGVAAAKNAIESVDGVSSMGYGLEQVFRELDFIPALKDQIEDSKVPDGVSSILNLLMFGSHPDLMKKAMGAAIRAAAQVPGVVMIGAMNFGGEFGKYEYHLHELLQS